MFNALRYPSRRPIRWRPHALENILAVAVYNNQMPGSSFVQGLSYSGAPQSLQVSGLPLEVTGIAPGPDPSTPFYLQGPFELYANQTLLQPTAATASANGEYFPNYALNSIVYSGGNLYVWGGTQTQAGIMRFDATTGAPNGNGTNAMYLAGIGASTNCGMSLISGSVGPVSATALAIPLAEGLFFCPLLENGAAVPPVAQGPLPYSAFTGAGLPASVGLLAPQQSSATGLLYFPFFDGWNPSGGAGLISVNFVDALTAVEDGKPVTFTPVAALGSLPLTNAWCVLSLSGADVIYMAVPGWANATTAQWSVVTVQPSNGNISTIISGQPGIPWGVCPVTVNV